MLPPKLQSLNHKNNRVCNAMDCANPRLLFRLWIFVCFCLFISLGWSLSYFGFFWLFGAQGDEAKTKGESEHKGCGPSLGLDFDFDLNIDRKAIKYKYLTHVGVSHLTFHQVSCVGFVIESLVVAQSSLCLESFVSFEMVTDNVYG